METSTTATKSIWFLLLCFCGAVNFVLSTSDINTTDLRLTKVALLDAIYSRPALRHNTPPIPPGGVLDVTFDFYIFHITKVVETDQFISLCVFYNMSWLDHDLAWRPADYANITDVNVPSGNIWHPRLFVANSLHEKLSYLDVAPSFAVLDSGQVTEEFGAMLQLACAFDLTYFPFDEQNCFVMLVFRGAGVFIRPKIEMSESSNTKTLMNQQFKNTDEWTLTSLDTFTMISEPDKSVVIISLKMKRAFIYYVVCMVAPLIITSLMTSLVFWIPSGERMAFLVSLLVASTLYLTYVG